MKLTSWLPGALLCLGASQVSAFNATSIAETIVHAIENAAECSACEGILETLKASVLFGDDAFNEALIEVCKISGAEDDDVCTGVIEAEGPILAYALRNMHIGSHTAELLCAHLLGLCDYPKVVPRKLDLPKPEKRRSRLKPSKKDPIHVVHISDTHVDLEYETGSNFNCTKPICCRSYTPEDAPGNTSYPAGPFGETTCDPPRRLLKNMVDGINELVPDSAFTIFTSDIIPHDVWLVNRREVLRSLETTYTDITDLRLAFPAVGNHDAAPVNAFPPQGLPVYNDVNPRYTYNKLAKKWKKWIGAQGSKSTGDYGSYSVVYPGSKLRVISFNSIFYYVLNFWMYEDPMEEDPNGQFKWFVKELQAAETAGERVWLLAHIPPGNSDFFRDYSDCFDQIIQRYHATIAATFYGHTHRDEFEVAYSNYKHRTAGNARMVSYIAPSMTPTSGSPSFRVYSVDPETFAILDYTQYIADFTSPQYQKGPVWEKYYSAKEAYGTKLKPKVTDPHAELTPAFWHNVTELFEQDDSAFQSYISHKSRGYKPETCTGDCKKLEICGMRAASSEYNCQTTTPGLSFSKRENHASVHHHDGDDCGESRVRVIFASILTRDRKDRAAGL